MWKKITEDKKSAVYKLTRNTSNSNAVKLVFIWLSNNPTSSSLKYVLGLPGLNFTSTVPVNCHFYITLWTEETATFKKTLCHLLGVQEVELFSNREVASSIPTTPHHVSKCPWARYCTPKRSKCAGWQLRLQSAPPSVCEWVDVWGINV